MIANLPQQATGGRGSERELHHGLDPVVPDPVQILGGETVALAVRPLTVADFSDVILQTEGQPAEIVDQRRTQAAGRIHVREAVLPEIQIVGTDYSLPGAEILQIARENHTLKLPAVPEADPGRRTSRGRVFPARVFIEPAVPEVCQHAGVRRVVEAILESKKPLVGFQTMGDVMYMLGGIYKELPRTLPEFLEMMKEVELLVDLKEVVEMEGLKEEDIRHCNLTHAYQQVEQGKKK